MIEGIHDYKTSAKNERNGCVRKKCHFIPVRTQRHVLLQKVCLGVICENKKVEGTLLTEKVREVFGGVRGARIHNHNKVRGCGCLTECYGTNPIFSSFSWHFWTGTSWYTFTIGVRVSV